MLSHHHAAAREQPASPFIKQRRRRSRLLAGTSSSSSARCSGLLLLLLALLSCVSLSEAHGSRRARAGASSRPALLPGTVPAWEGPSLVLDASEPPMVPPFMPPAHHGDATRTASAPPSKRSLETDPKASGAGFEIPRAFDSALSNNFTNNCAAFFKTMLTSDTVNDCHPFSLMLQTSNSLFQASKSFVRITQTLEATCSTDSTRCTTGTNDLALQLLTDDACKVDYDNNNPQVVQAYNGLIAYEPLYRASCLRDDDGSFCYANAVTNTTSEGADAIPFYLPLGLSMPSGARPTCNSCLQDEMAIFSAFASNSTQPASQTYAGAAHIISIYCGNTFVNVTAAPLKGAASTTTATLTPTISLLIMLFVFFFQ